MIIERIEVLVLARCKVFLIVLVLRVNYLLLPIILAHQRGTTQFGKYRAYGVLILSIVFIRKVSSSSLQREVHVSQRRSLSLKDDFGLSEMQCLRHLCFVSQSVIFF